MKKVLFVCGQEFILNQLDGGKKYSYRNYCMLKEAFGEENVYAYIFTNDNHKNESHIHRESPYSSIIERIWNVLLLHPFCSIRQAKKMHKYILDNGFNLIIFDRSMYGPNIKRLRKEGIETQIFIQNIERNYFYNKMKTLGIYYFLPYVTTILNEKMSIKYADKIFCLTERDRNIIQEMYNKKCDAIIPMTFKDCFSKEKVVNSPNTSTKNLLFIGSLFPPNYDGIKWFKDNVMIHLPEFFLSIVGKDFEKKREDLETSNIKVIGTVDDLEPFYYSDAAMVMPILYGDGIKIKTAEAMMYGKPIFATDEALEGYDVDNVDGIYRCNSVDEFISNIRNAFDKQTNMGYSESVRNVFFSKYESANALKIYMQKEKIL